MPTCMEILAVKLQEEVTKSEECLLLAYGCQEFLTITLRLRIFVEEKVQ